MLAATALFAAQGGDQVGTFNMAGQAKNKGETAVAEDVMRSMLARRPVVMTLQEVCYTQFHHVRATAGPPSTPSSWAATSTRARRSC